VSVNGSLVSLIYKDSGPGLPDSVTLENSQGFGLQLVRMLSEQIGGTVKFERVGGTKFVIEFMV